MHFQFSRLMRKADLDGLLSMLRHVSNHFYCGVSMSGGDSGLSYYINCNIIQRNCVYYEYI